MVVHVKLRAWSKKGCVRDLVVLANGGAHSPEPVLVVDEEEARELGYEGGEVVEASVADSTRAVYLVRGVLELALIGEGLEELARTKAHLVIHPRLEEPLITDTTIDELGIQVVSFSKGLWRHVNDPPGKVRRSAAGEAFT
ncbi:MAG: hypothetical protein N3H31_05210 [Candidatus Nezhaarchaeota archaeon]|nr:hypothetical protein [Candidatus Nezhaarchaeota archaeon]